MLPSPLEGEGRVRGSPMKGRRVRRPLLHDLKSEAFSIR